MTKHKQKRSLLSRMMEASDPVPLVETAITYQIPGAPDYLYIFSKEERPHFLAFTTPEGLVYQCNPCGGMHILFWHESDYSKAPDMPRLRHAPGRIRALWEELRDKHYVK